MYGLYWRILPGPTWLKIIITVILVAAIIAVLFKFGFKAIEPYMPFTNDSSIDGG